MTMANIRDVLQRLSEFDGTRLTLEMRHELEETMSLRCLCSSFILSGSIDEIGDRFLCLDMEMLKEVFEPLTTKVQLLKEVAEVIVKHYENLSTILCKATDTSNLRVIPVLLQCPAFRKSDERWSRQIIVNMAHTLCLLEKNHPSQFEVLGKWWRQNPDLFQTAIEVFLEGFRGLRRSKAYTEVKSITSFIGILSLLNKVNRHHGCIVPISCFYMDELKSSTHMEQHLQCYMVNRQRFWTFIDHPFLMNVGMKWHIFRLGRMVEQQQILEQHNAEMVDVWFRILVGLPSYRKVTSPYINFEVDRDDIFQSTRQNLEREKENLRKPLTVHFKGDVAVGLKGGGPMKEFFYLIFEELLKEERNVFKKLDSDATCTTFWFNKECKDQQLLRWAGQLLGLAIYNNAIVTLPFPVLFFKKLLTDSASSLQDLNDLDPTMARSLNELNKMSEVELSEQEYTFTVNDSRGATIELRPGGTNEVLTLRNVHEYIELYARHHTSHGQAETFRQGFLDVFSNVLSHANHLFAPEELREVFLGGEYDWMAFEKSVNYSMHNYQSHHISYDRNHRVIKMFWEVFHDLDEEKKRKFLRFMTGADHVPIGGFSVIGARIWPLGGDEECKGASPKDICPEVNTCHGFVVLHLPKYKTKEQLKYRLLKALELNTGFHKVPQQ